MVIVKQKNGFAVFLFYNLKFNLFTYCHNNPIADLTSRMVWVAIV